MTPSDLYQRLGARRLTARSVIASTLLGATPPELPTRSLVGTAELLGIAPGTARVAMSRMVAAGELHATGDGYRLVGPTLVTRQARQTRSRAGNTRGWDGDWRMYVVTGDARPQAERLELRTRMTAARFGELRAGVWLRPDNLMEDDGVGLGAEPPDLVTMHDLVPMTCRPADPLLLAAALWDVRAWSDRTALLLAEIERLLPPLEGGAVNALEEGFVVSAAVLRHFQADPLLPDELLPDDWPGPLLRARYDAYDSAFRTTLDTWQRSDR